MRGQVVRLSVQSRKLKLILLAAVASLALGVIPAFADTISGNAVTSGTVTVTSTTISFTSAGGANTFVPVGPDTGSFAGITGGTINNLSGGGSGAANVPGFMSFTGGASTVFFDLNFISPGTGTVAGCGSNAIGSICTPAGSPFTLTQVGSNLVAITFTFGGAGYTGSSASGSTPTQIVFTSQLAGTISSILAGVASGGGGFSSTYSATVTSTPVGAVPEPSSLLLLGSGALGLVAPIRRKFLR